MYQTLVSTIPLLEDPPFVIMIVVLATAIGRRAMLTIGLREETDKIFLEKVVFTAALGMGLLQYLFFGLGMAGKATPQAVWIGLSALLLLFLGDIISFFIELWHKFRAIKVTNLDTFSIAVYFCLAAWLGLYLVGSLSPVTDSDGQLYHLTAPKRWLQQSNIAPLPTYTMTYWPLGVEMLFSLAMAVWSDTAAKLIHFTLGTYAILASYVLGRILGSRTTGFLLATFVLIFCNRPPFLQFQDAFVDLGIVLQTLCAIIAFIHWHRSKIPGWLYVSALCAGFSASFKLTGILLGCAIFLATVIILRKNRAPSLRTGLVAGVLALLPVIPWFARAWVYSGNPLYPMLSSVFPTANWNSDIALIFNDFFKYFNWGVSREGLGLLLRQKIYMAAILGWVGFAFVAFIYIRRVDFRILIGLAFLPTLGSLWITGPYFRYLMPFILIVAAAVLSLVSNWLESTPFRGKAIVLGAIIVGLASCVFTLRETLPDSFAAATGKISREEYLKRQLSNYSMWQYINTTLPSNARVLSFLEGTYYSDPMCYVAMPHMQSAIRFDKWEHFLEDLDRYQINYVMFTENSQRWFDSQYMLPRNSHHFIKRIKQAGRLLKSQRLDRLYEFSPAKNLASSNFSRE